MRALARRVGRFGTWMAAAVGVFIVGFDTWQSPKQEWGSGLLGCLLMIAVALPSGWVAARAPRRPILAGIVLWLYFVLYGALALGYRDQEQAGDIHAVLLVPPAAFFLAGLFAMVGKFTEAPPQGKT